MSLHMCVVTSNSKKFREISTVLARFQITTERVDVDLLEPQSLDAKEIVAMKAREAFARVKRPVIVDDSGFYIDRYDRFPGTLSKYIFRGIGYEGLFRLCEEGERAHFECTVGYMDATCVEPVIATAEYSGHVERHNLKDMKEEMPYATLFVPDDAHGKRMIEMTPEERGHDHRAQALERCVHMIQARRA